MADVEQAARQLYNSAGGSYPVAEQLAPAVPVQAPVAPPAAVPGQPSPEPPLSIEERAREMYAPVQTSGSVDWNEPAAEPDRFDLQAPPGVLDRSEAGQAAMSRLRAGLAAAGAGRTIARELFGDAVRVAQEGRAMPSQAAAEAELRAHFGHRYDERVAAARGLVQRAAARCPEIITFLEQTGLGNSPEFVRKLAAAAGRRGR